MIDIAIRPVVLRGAALAGVGSAGILLVNAAKRAQILPTTAVTQLIAPLAEAFALALLLGLYAAAGRKAGLLGDLAIGVNVLALALLTAAELVINLVFAHLPGATITELRHGPLGVALTVTSLLFLLGSFLQVAAMWRALGSARPALIGYALGAVPVALRAFVPEAVLDLAVMLLGLSVGWLAVWLWTYTTTATRRALP
jgi:hypothetical protein